VLRRIEPQDAGFRLIFAPDHEIEADYVVIAIPFTCLREVQIQVDLPVALRVFIQEVDLGDNEHVIAGFSERFWQTADGFVLRAWTDLGFAEVWDATQRQVDRTDAALTFFLGGDQVRRMELGDLQVEGQKFAGHLETFVPGAAHARSGRFVRSRWSRDPFARGAYTNFKPGQLTGFGEFLYIESDVPDDRQDVHVGNLVFAGEHLSDTYSGYMNGRPKRAGSPRRWCWTGSRRNGPPTLLPRGAPVGCPLCHRGPPLAARGPNQVRNGRFRPAISVAGRSVGRPARDPPERRQPRGLLIESARMAGVIILGSATIWLQAYGPWRREL
jgi:Flavin containing amine oxidoreductase